MLFTQKMEQGNDINDFNDLNKSQRLSIFEIKVPSHRLRFSEKFFSTGNPLLRALFHDTDKLDAIAVNRQWLKRLNG